MSGWKGFGASARSIRLRRGRRAGGGRNGAACGVLTRLRHAVRAAHLCETRSFGTIAVMSDLVIRPELPSDVATISAVIREAFESAAHADGRGLVGH